MQCANCLRRYSSYSIKNDWWCPTDQALFCQKCLTEEAGCPFCGRKVKGTSGVLLIEGIAFLILGLFVAAAILPGAYAGQQLNEMPTTQAGHLPGTGTVKVAGVVAGGQGSVIVVFQYHDSSGTETGRHVRDFWLNDSSGGVLVRMGSNFSVSPSIVRGGHEYPANVSGPGFQYESGDAISVIGVEENTPSGPAIVAQEVAPGPHSFSTRSFTVDVEIFGPLLSIPAGVVVAGLAIAHRRVGIATSRLPQFAARRPRARTPAPAADSIVWLDNPIAGRMYRIGIVAIVLAVLAAATFLIVVFSPIVFSSDVFTAVIVSTPLIVLFAGISGLVFYRGGRTGIQRIGTSAAGVYAEYRARPKYAPEFLAWQDIQGFEGPLQLNPKAMRLDTASGKEFFTNVPPATIAAVRAAFESSRPVALTSGTVVIPTVDSLRGVAAPRSRSEPLRVKNPLPGRWYRWSAALLALQIAVFPLGVLLFERVGINQGLVLFIFPGIMAVTLFRNGRNAPQSVEMTETGFEVQSRASVRSVLWSDIDELTPYSRGLRYKTRAGTVDSINLLDRSAVVEILGGLRRARGFATERAPVQWAGPPGWMENIVFRRSRLWVIGMVGGPAVVMAVSAILVFVTGSPAFIFGAIFPVVVALFALFPWVVYRSAPARVSVGPKEIAVDYGGRTPDLLMVQNLPLSEVAYQVPPGSSRTAATSGFSLPGLTTRVVSFRTTSGLVLVLGPISPEIEEKVLLQLTPAQRNQGGGGLPGQGRFAGG